MASGIVSPKKEAREHNAQGVAVLTCAHWPLLLLLAKCVSVDVSPSAFTSLHSSKPRH
jgi:hypothetical protein